MVAAFVKVTKIQNPGGNSQGLAVTSTASNALFVVASGYYSGTVGTPTFSVSGGGTWTADGNNNQHIGTTDNFVTGFASCPSATGGSHTITITFGVAIGSFTGFVYEFSGMATSSILDTLGTGTQGAASPVSTTALTNAGQPAVFLAIGGTLSSGGETQTSTGTGWTMPAGGNETNGAAQVTIVTGYKIVSTVAAQTETWTDSPSVPWASLIAAYKALGWASGGGGGGSPVAHSHVYLQAVTQAANW